MEPRCADCGHSQGQHDHCLGKCSARECKCILFTVEAGTRINDVREFMGLPPAPVFEAPQIVEKMDSFDKSQLFDNIDRDLKWRLDPNPLFSTLCLACDHTIRSHMIVEQGKKACCCCPCKEFDDPRPSPVKSDEIRTTSSTGGEKGVKPQRYDLIPIHPLNQLAELYGKGAEKYAAHNFRKGYEWSKSYAAAMRHMTAFWNGEDIDPEMGLPHVICASFHMFALAEFMKNNPEFDDRYKIE